MIHRVAGLILFLVLTNADASTGGEPADPNTFRYPISVALRGGSIYTPDCIGAQIAPDTMITAAHCVKTGQPHVVKWLPQEILASPVKTVAVHPDYRPPGTGPADVAVLRTRKKFPLSNLSYDGSFDPYAYLKQQPRQETLVDAFGWNDATLQIYTGKSLVTTGDKCLDQIDDLKNHEWNALSEAEKKSINVLSSGLKLNRTSLFCSFKAKRESFQLEQGDSGSPLVFTEDGKTKLAGLLISGIPLPSSQQYSHILVYVNIAVSRNFLAECLAAGRISQNSPTVARTSDSASASCHYHGTDSENIAVLSFLLQ